MVRSAPGVHALGSGEPRVERDRLDAKTSLKAPNELRCEADLGNQNEHLTSFVEFGGDQVQVDFRLPAAGHAIDDIARDGSLQLWPRPPVPEFAEITGILGEEIHLMLRREKTVTAALADAQDRAHRLIRASGRYLIPSVPSCLPPFSLSPYS